MTSRILVGDMLQSDIPTELVTGVIVLHAEKFDVACCICALLKAAE